MHLFMELLQVIVISTEEKNQSVLFFVYSNTQRYVFFQQKNLYKMTVSI